jgi:putative membrane protein
MKKVFAYGTVVLALSAAPLLAQQPGSGSSGGARTDTAGAPGGSGSQARPNQPATDTAGSRPTGQASGTPTRSTAASSQASTADHQFIMEAARGGMAEVELGQLAKDKAQSDAVKQFGERMVTDHGKANDELKTLAQSKNITLPADLDAKHKATKDKLSKLSGAQFDRAYMQEMVSDHQKDVNEFRKQSQSAKDPEVKAWAAKTLPTLQEHLQMAQAASRSAVGTSGTRSPNSGGDRQNGGTRGTTPSPGSSGAGSSGPTGSGGATGSTPGTGTAPGAGSTGSPR